MPVVNIQSLVKLQHNPDKVRNVCILAHVDHGKTSLTDSLIATNGIISPKMAGKIRYLDSRPDEQTRGITMESSAISLYFSLLRRSELDSTPELQEYLINVIDSPGHVDFSSEVSTASRLCDGAIVLVDAVEGVCSQTVAVLRQAWMENLKPILVINKLDRLIMELKMSPGEAYIHLSKLLEQINAVMGSFYQGERMEDDMKWRERMEARSKSLTMQSVAPNSEAESGPSVIEVQDDEVRNEYEERGDDDIYFEPEKGNVIFSSAIDGWAFTVKQFAGLYEKKLGIKRRLLEKVLWGDFYLDPKTKRVLTSKHLKGRSLKPMFVQLVLDNIWAVYQASAGSGKSKGEFSMVEKIASSLSINLPSHVLKSRDPRAVLTAIFAAWIPLSTALLVSVIEHLPSPKAAQGKRMSCLIEASPGSGSVSNVVLEATRGLHSARSDPIVAFVSKMVAVPEKDLPENKTKVGQTLTPDEARELGRKKRAEIARAQAAARDQRPDVAELKEVLRTSKIGTDEHNGTHQEELEDRREPERLIGFARLFSGTLEIGDEVYVLSPKFTPDQPYAKPEPQKVTVTALYLLMGRELEPLISVPPGVVFGIGGLEGYIMKSGTLCSQLEGSVNLAGVSMGSQPIVRVAIEPLDPSDLDKLVAGMRMLEQSDPCAAYEILDNGEHVILTAGELHLERCLKDLRERFARCEIQVGSPIVPYRETIVNAAEMNPTHDKDLPRGTVISTLPSKQVTVRLRVRPLPSLITQYLVSHEVDARRLYTEQEARAQGTQNIGNMSVEDRLADIEIAGILSPSKASSLEQFSDDLDAVFAKVKGERDMWKNVTQRLVTFGPRRNGPNILVDATASHICRAITLGSLIRPDEQVSLVDAECQETTLRKQQSFSDNISYAFQLAMAQGPLCQEPMQGIAVFVEDVSFPQTQDEQDNIAGQSGRLTGEMIRTVRDSILKGFLDWSPRLLLAMYSCEIQASTEVLGRVYGVITRRRGHILSEAMNEGTPFFSILASLPVAESFGFSDEIRKRTSGAASPQLIFAGYEMILDEDPFWVPFTEEELEDLGETADKENVAKKYMNLVRKRKGLFVQGKKIVESAEKQKTLKR